MLDAKYDALYDEFVYDMGIASALGRGVNSYAHYDVELFELGHELGMRVHHALEQEFQGFGAIFDLRYLEYLRENGEL
jgi:hypothetical protein